MNWDAIGAIGQVLGSIAVLVTLGYLAIQVGHARREVQRSVSQNRTENFLQLTMHQSQGHVLLAATKADAALGGNPESVHQRTHGAGRTSAGRGLCAHVQQSCLVALLLPANPEGKRTCG